MKIAWCFILFISQVILTDEVLGQPKNERLAESEFLFSNNKFAAALPYYQKMLMTDSMNAELNYKTAVCYLNSRSQKEKALPYIKKTISLHSKEVQMQTAAYKLLAEACFATSHFDEAIAAYKNYETLLSTKDPDKSVLEEINTQIEICRMAKELKELKELTFSLVNQKFTGDTGKNNSTYRRYTSYSAADQSTLTFIFKKIPEDRKDLPAKNLFKATQVQLQESNDTSTVERETTVATSVDGQIILTYRNDNGDGTLYTSRLYGNEWTLPEKLSKNNNANGWEQNEFISADGETLYFALEREEGFGGKDIYKSVRSANGEWGKAINMGYPINSPFDDEAPAIHPDGVTLYFSSNRSKIKNRFDIFTCSLADTGIINPINVGYPLTKQKNAPAAENDEKHLGKENYAATFINSKSAPLTLIKGKVLCKDKERIPYIEITLTDNETGKIMGVYAAESSNGHYSCILPSGKDCNITFETKNYLFHSENVKSNNDFNFYKLYKTIELKPVSENSKEILNNVFFTEHGAILSPTSFTELNRLTRLMLKNAKLVIELSATVNSTDKNNEKAELFKNRIQSITNYLLEKGVSKEQIQQRIYRNSKKKKEKKGEPQKPEENRDKIEFQILTID